MLRAPAAGTQRAAAVDLRLACARASIRSAASRIWSTAPRRCVCAAQLHRARRGPTRRKPPTGISYRRTAQRRASPPRSTAARDSRCGYEFGTTIEPVYKQMKSSAQAKAPTEQLHFWPDPGEARLLKVLVTAKGSGALRACLQTHGRHAIAEATFSIVKEPDGFLASGQEQNRRVFQQLFQMRARQ